MDGLIIYYRATGFANLISVMIRRSSSFLDKGKIDTCHLLVYRSLCCFDLNTRIVTDAFSVKKNVTVKKFQSKE